MLRSTCLALLAFAGMAFADVQTGLVRSGGQAIPGATVTAECGTDKITTTTDDAGRFEIGGLPSTSCKYTILMFGFEPLQKDTAASSTPLSLDMTLQTRASIPVAPSAAPPVVAAPVTPTASAPAPAAPVTPPAAPQGPMPSLTTGAGRGGPGGPTGAGGRGQQAANGRGAQQTAGGRGGQAGGRGAQGGFQNLSLTQNADNALTADAPESVLGGADSAGGGAGASDAFTVNGTVSQGVQAQAGDGFGMGGPGGFGFGPGGPGGPGGDFGGGGGFGGPGGGGPGGGGRGGPGGDGGGRGGPGGPGGGGFAGGGGRGGPGGGFGGPGGPGGRGGPGGPGRGPNGVTAFGNRAGRGRGPQWMASVNYNFANSALNARPYSFASASGTVPIKAATANNQFGFTLGGPIMIPKTKVNLKNSRWSLNYTGARNRQGSDLISSVPTAVYRSGDFSTAPNIIYDPLSHGVTPFGGNIIPPSRISSIAVGLMKYIPNPTGIGNRNNYELVATNPNNNNNISLQLSDPITTKDRLNLNYSHQGRDSSRTQNFGFVDPTNGSGNSLSLSYSRTIRPTLVNNLSLSVNRNITDTFSFFSYGANVAGDLGITGILATPATYGPPTIGFTNFNSLNDGVPSSNHSTNYSLTDGLTKVKGKHNLSTGITLSARQTNQLTANNARGSFTFSGVNTQQIGGSLGTSGYDLADFLLGLPASTSVVQYVNGNDKFYYRQKTAAVYVNDDFRASAKLTVNMGLRWEFYGPQTEKRNHMANLDFSPSGANVAGVAPGQTSPYSSDRGAWSDGLIDPDYRLFQPQSGIAWKPWSKRALVIRAGYGIRFNGSSLTQFGSRLSIQQPYVNPINLTSTTTPGLTLQDGFTAPASTTILNSYGVSRDYKPAMAQQWNSIVQYTFKTSYVVQMTYNGVKGTGLDILQGPNRATPGPLATASLRVPISYALSTIQYNQSIGNSIYHAGAIQLTRRFARGLSGGATYTMAKGISNSSTLGGGVVQIENNLQAERAVTSDPRHTIALIFNYQTLAGNQKKEFYWNFLRGWQLNGSYNLNSGSPFTATVAGDPSGTGVVGAARANSTGLDVTSGTGYFNPAAFSVPALGTYGNAGRNTIPGIWNFTMSASAMRSFRLGERRRLSLTFNANNPFNHPSITGFNTTIGSIQVGQVTSAGQMRSVSAQARITF